MKYATGEEVAANEPSASRELASKAAAAANAPGVVDARTLICALRRARVAATVALWLPALWRATAGEAAAAADEVSADGAAIFFLTGAGEKGTGLADMAAEETIAGPACVYDPIGLLFDVGCRAGGRRRYPAAATTAAAVAAAAVAAAAAAAATHAEAGAGVGLRGGSSSLTSQIGQ